MGGNGQKKQRASASQVRQAHKTPCMPAHTTHNTPPTKALATPTGWWQNAAARLVGMVASFED